MSSDKLMLNLQQINYSIANKIILKDLSFEVVAGDFWAIVGANGSGKSTLLKIIVGIITTYKGSVFVDNRCKIGYVPQEKTFDKNFPVTALELVLTGINGRWKFKISKYDLKLAMQTLECIGATNVAKKQLSDLSGGELQKVYLARAMVQQPDLLLLDEPSVALDTTSESHFLHYIKSLNSNNQTAILMVTHDTKMVKEHANKILELVKN